MNSKEAQRFIALSQFAALERAMLADAATLPLCWLQQDLIRYLHGETGRNDSALSAQLQTDTALQQRWQALLTAMQSQYAPAAAAAADNHNLQRQTATFALQLKAAKQRPQTYVLLKLLQPLADDGEVPVLHLLLNPPQRLVFSPLADGCAQLLLQSDDVRLTQLLSCPLSLVF